MLIPQTDEVDLQSTSGVDRDDINSLVEYVDQEILDNIDYRDCRFIQIDCSHIIYFAQFISNDCSALPKCPFPNFLVDQITSVSFDIVSPPPEA
jgi:hypothetical protein